VEKRECVKLGKSNFLPKNLKKIGIYEISKHAPSPQKSECVRLGKSIFPPKNSKKFGAARVRI
jgi:hypothetical protein